VSTLYVKSRSAEYFCVQVVTPTTVLAPTAVRLLRRHHSPSCQRLLSWRSEQSIKKTPSTNPLLCTGPSILFSNCRQTPEAKTCVVLSAEISSVVQAFGKPLEYQAECSLAFACHSEMFSKDRWGSKKGRQMQQQEEFGRLLNDC
jgi:hypothetical protein